jgi:hypothetical protein
MLLATLECRNHFCKSSNVSAPRGKKDTHLNPISLLPNSDLLAPPCLWGYLLLCRLALGLCRRPAEPSCCLWIGCELSVLSWAQQSPCIAPTEAHRVDSLTLLCTGPETKGSRRTFIGHLPPCRRLLTDSRWRDVEVNEVCVLASSWSSASGHWAQWEWILCRQWSRPARKVALSPKVEEGGMIAYTGSIQLHSVTIY